MSNMIVTKKIQGSPEGVTYTNPEGSVIEVGGISEGTTFSNTTFDEFVDLLLYPELFGTLTNPSLTFSSSVTGLREINAIIPVINFTAFFNRGSISPQYQSDSQFRSGLPNTYTYTGTGLVTRLKDDLTDNQSISDYTVLSGNQSWSCRVSYDAGVQPKGSKGTPFGLPLQAGQTSTITRTITGVYPYFATTVNISTMTKQSLVNHGVVVTTNLIGESGSYKQSVEFSHAHGEITNLQQWNPLSSQWDPISLNTFSLSTVQNNINGNMINYHKYVHIGALIGGRTLRWS